MDTHETKIFTAILIAAGILAILLLFFFITIIRHQRKNIELHKQKLLAEITTLEKERKRVASDLHDDLGPLLSAVKLQISSIDPADETDRQLIEKSGRYIDELLGRVREIATDLMPQVLARKNFIFAIKEFTDRINTGNALKISYEIDNDEPPVEKNKEVHIYRIVQEIIHNSLKHSGAQKIELKIYSTDKILNIRIRDDGKGFKQEEPSNLRGHGLRNILSRVELLEGEMFLQTAPGSGVDYTIEIPL